MFKLQVKKTRTVMRWEDGHIAEGIPADYWQTTDVAEREEDLLRPKEAKAKIYDVRIVEGKRGE